MSPNKRIGLLLFIFAFVPFIHAKAQVGVGTVSPDASAELDVKSSTRGFLAPRMTTAQMNSITVPATGLTVYNTDSSTICIYTGSAWLKLLSTKAYVSGATGASTTDSMYTTGSGYSIKGFRSSSISTSGLTGTFNNNTYARVTLNVSIGDSRTLVGIYRIYLVGPNGFRTRLLYDGATENMSGSELTNTTFTTSATASIADGSSPYGDTYASGESFSLLYGAPLNGTWTLLVEAQSAAVNVGQYITINSWSLELSSNVDGDNLGDHTATSNVRLACHYLSNDGGDEGILIGNTGNVGINATPSSDYTLFIGGSTSTNTFRMTQNAVNGYVLKSDAAGNASWTNPASLVSSNWATSGNDQYSALSGNVGIGTSSPLSLFHVSGGNLLVSGTYGSGRSIEATGTGARLFFDAKKAALRAGYAGSSSWDSTNLGNYSVGLGYQVTASGTGTVALGRGASATNLYSVAMGNFNVASGSTSAAIGANNTASGDNANTFGVFNTASGSNALALGSYCTTSAAFSYAFGTDNSVSGSGGVAVGNQCTVSGNYGTAIGNGNTASASYSVAFGRGLTTSSYGELALGAWNTSYTPSGTSSWNTADRLLSLGNGTSDGARSDALVVLKSGKVGIGISTPGQALEVAGTTKTDKLQLTDGAGSGYVLQSDASGNASWVSATTLASGNWTTSGSDQYAALSGNVGIGTTSPGSKLDVQGSATINVNVQSSAGNAYVTTAAPSGLESGLRLQTYSGGSTGSRWILGKSIASESGSNAGSDFFINAYSDAGSFLSQPIAIKRATGNVGINTSSASNTLEVNGSFGTKVKAAQTAGTNSPDATAVVWIYSTGTGTITLPAAGSCANRMYTIVNSTGAARTISSYKDLTGTAQTSLANGSSIWIISDGSNWYQIK